MLKIEQLLEKDISGVRLTPDLDLGMTTVGKD